MEKEIGIWLEKRKVEYSKWMEVLKEETLDGKVTRVFTEVCGKDSISVFYIDEGNTLKRRMKTERYGEIPGMRCRDVRGFSGFLRSGDVLGAGEGGTIYDSSLRYGLVTRSGGVLWLDRGNEWDVIETLGSVSWW
jgi:hypothetical protein